MGEEPGQKAAIERVDAADDEEKQKFAGKEMMFDFFDECGQRITSFRIQRFFLYYPWDACLCQLFAERENGVGG